MDFIENYPEIASSIFAVLFTGLGISLKYILDIFSENRKRKSELRSILWKEKIQAAKKASEHYFEQLNFIEVNIQHLNVLLNEKQTPDDLSVSLNKSISSLSDRVSNPKSFEHHHINIFYNIDYSEIRIHTDGIIDNVQDIHIYNLKNELSEEEFEQLKIVLQNLKANLFGLEQIYRRYLQEFRNDLEDFID